MHILHFSTESSNSCNNWASDSPPVSNHDDMYVAMMIFHVRMFYRRKCMCNVWSQWSEASLTATTPLCLPTDRQ